MPTSPERMDELLNSYVANTCSDAERNELFNLLKDDWERIESGRTLPGVDWDKMYENILGIKMKTVQRKISSWKRWAVAASILFVIGFSGYLLLNSPAKKTEKMQANFTNDVPAPKINKAIITLANGHTVSLDSLSSGTLATQGNTLVTKTKDGQVIYNGTTTDQKEVLNTLSNPRGSKVVSLTLADGSRVWLNAGSSLTYPVAFIGNQRQVSITGEAYFEVTHNPEQPFMVSKGDMEVKVLGTHFNVNAYDDENDIKITLLQGSVEVKNKNRKIKIMPGQQAIDERDGQLTINKEADLEQVMAWKNGLFKFKDVTIEPIMRELERWYNLDIVYQGTVKEHFITTVPRDVPVSQVFKYLEATGSVHFKIEGRKVFVKP